MKYIRQLGIILLVSFLGELLHYLLPLPVPASIYGLVLEIMPMLFVPAGVGLLEKWDVLRPVWLPFAAIVVVSTFTVFAAAGCTTQRVMRLRQKREDKR